MYPGKVVEYRGDCFYFAMQINFSSRNG